MMPDGVIIQKKDKGTPLMKITVFSDSHHDLNSMIYVLQEDVPDMVIHLGDNFGDARTLKNMFPEIAFECVSGNCDFESVDSEKKNRNR